MSIDTKPPTGSLVRKESLRWMAAPHMQRKIAFDVVHVASGVAGMQAALCAGVNVLPARSRMPALRQVSFHLLPGRRGEVPLVTQVRSLLAEHLSTT